MFPKSGCRACRKYGGSSIVVLTSKQIVLPSKYKTRIDEKDGKHFFDVIFKFASEDDQFIDKKIEFSNLIFTCASDGRIYKLDPNTVLSLTLTN